MTRAPLLRYARVALCAAALFGAGGGLAAQGAGTAALEVRMPWTRASAGMARTAAVYLTIVNHGQSADRLVAAASPVARTAAVHRHIMEGNIMRMRPVHGLEIAPGGTTVLEPGGLHVMLMGLRGPLTEGERFPLTLTFERAGDIQVEVAVTALGAPAPADPHK